MRRKSKGHMKLEVREQRNQLVGWLASCTYRTPGMIGGDGEKVLSHLSLGWKQKVLLIACR